MASHDEELDYAGGGLKQETNWWGAFVIGLAGTILVTGIAPVMVTTLGASAIPVIIFITVTGYLLCLLLAELSAMMPERTGGSPSYAYPAYRERWPRLAKHINGVTAWAYWLGWFPVAPLNMILASFYLADRFHLNSAQIRKDLAYFGEFGVRGVGYVVADLKRQLVQILGLTRNRRVVIVGAGNLGMALADYGGFNREGFSIVALFDNDPRKVGVVSRGGVPVMDIGRLPAVAKSEKVSIAVVAVPAGAAQKVLDLVVEAGIRAVLNFAPVRLAARAGITLKAVDLKIQLENLAFHLARAEGS